jgi:putative FmdB family regulatory protein
MPVYEFECAKCGSFDEIRSLEQSRAAASCPYCGSSSPRVFSIVNLRSMNPTNRIAHERNERSAHAPHVCGSGCSHSHAKSKPKVNPKTGKPALQYSTKQNSRPWMLGH